MPCIFFFCHLNKRLNKQSVQFLKGIPVNILMSPVKRVGSSNKTADRLEFLFFIKELPCIFWFETQAFKRTPIHTPQQLNWTAKRGIPHSAIDRIHPR